MNDLPRSDCRCVESAISEMEARIKQLEKALREVESILEEDHSPESGDPWTTYDRIADVVTEVLNGS